MSLLGFWRRHQPTVSENKKAEELDKISDRLKYASDKHEESKERLLRQLQKDPFKAMIEGIKKEFKGH